MIKILPIIFYGCDYMINLCGPEWIQSCINKGQVFLRKYLTMPQFLFKVEVYFNGVKPSLEFWLLE